MRQRTVLCFCRNSSTRSACCALSLAAARAASRALSASRLDRITASFIAASWAAAAAPTSSVLLCGAAGIQDEPPDCPDLGPGTAAPAPASDFRSLYCSISSSHLADISFASSLPNRKCRNVRGIHMNHSFKSCFAW